MADVPEPEGELVDVGPISLTLPAGASTSALQVTGNASLASIDSKLTAPLSVAIGSIALPTGASTSALQAAGNATLSSIDSKLTSPITVTGALTDTQLRATAVPVSLASVPLATGAATSALQTTGNTSLASIDSKLTSPLAVTGTFFQATQPVSATSLPLPTGASTSALQTTGNTSLSSIDGKLNSLGQKTSANSAPVVLSSDQSAIPVTDNGGSLTVDGSVSLIPVTTGGTSVYRNINQNATPDSVKGSAGQVYGWYIQNNQSNVRYVKIYNKATAPVIASDAALLVMTLAIPGNAAANVSFSTGIAFSSGIGIAAVTGVADTNTGNPAANEVIVNLMYK